MMHDYSDALGTVSKHLYKAKDALAGIQGSVTDHKNKY
jgi:hypothetical protein